MAASKWRCARVPIDVPRLAGRMYGPHDYSHDYPPPYFPRRYQAVKRIDELFAIERTCNVGERLKKGRRGISRRLLLIG